MRAMCFLCVAIRCYAFFVLWRIIILKTKRLRNEFVINIDNPNLTFDEMKVSSTDMCRWRCLKCGNEWEVKFKSRAGQKSGQERGCKECADFEQGKRVTARALEKGAVAENKKLLEEWDWDKNILNPYATPLSSEKSAFWICNKCNYHFPQKIVKRSKGKQGCPKCAGKVIELDNSMATLVPEIYDYIDTDYNDKPPTQYHPNSHNNIHLKCPKCGYKWSSKPYVFSAGHRCAACAGKIATEQNNLKTVYPTIADLFLEEKNGIKSTEIAPHSNKSYYFTCGICGSPRKLSVDKAVVRGVLCKKCSARYQTSFPQEAIHYYAIQYFGDEVESRFLINGDKAGEVDVYIPKLIIGIEYDSDYRHNNPEKIIADRKKDKLADDNGVLLLRLIETNNNDIKSKLFVKTKIRCSDLELSNAIYDLFKIIDSTIDYDINISRDRIKILELFYEKPVKNNLKLLYPQVTNDWDYDRNGNLKPEFFTVGSNQAVYWKGKDRPLQIRGIVQKYKRYSKKETKKDERS